MNVDGAQKDLILSEYDGIRVATQDGLNGFDYGIFTEVSKHALELEMQVTWMM